MRLLLDQMLDRDVAAALTDLGCDVACASDRNLATADDSEVLARAVTEKRVLVTLDGHFGDWVVLPLGAHPGVIRVKATNLQQRLTSLPSCGHLWRGTGLLNWSTDS